MLGRRFLLLVAVLMGLTALAASLAPRDPAVRDASDAERRRATPVPQVAEPAPPAAPDEAATNVRTISADDERPPRVVVAAGEVVELEVAGSIVDSVELMGRIDAIDPDSPARFSVLADEPGEYPITLVDANRRIGTLEVR